MKTGSCFLHTYTSYIKKTPINPNSPPLSQPHRMSQEMAYLQAGVVLRYPKISTHLIPKTELPLVRRHQGQSSRYNNFSYGRHVE